MRLNLRIVEEALGETCVGRCYGSLPHELMCAHPLLYVPGMDLLPDCVYVARSGDLEKAPWSGDFFSAVCIGEVPDRYRGGAADLVSVGEMREPDSIFKQVLDVFRSYGAWADELDSLDVRQQGLRGFALSSTKVFNNPISVWSAGFRNIFSCHRLFGEGLIIGADDVAGYDREYTKFRDDVLIPYEDISFFTSDERFAEIVREGVPAFYEPRWERIHCRALVYPLGERGKPRGYLFVDEVHRKFSEGDLSRAAILGGYMRRLLPAESELAQGLSVVDEVLRDLLDRKGVDESMLADAFRRMGWMVDDRLRIVIVSAGEGDIPDFVRRKVEALAAQHPYSVRAVPSSPCLAFLANETCLQDEFCAIVEQSLSQRPPYQILVGCSAPFRGLKNLSCFYDQAAAALRLCGEVASPSAKKGFALCSYDDCFTRHMLEKCSKGTVREALVPECLQRLIEHDEKHGTFLVAALKAYLENGHSVAKASQAMFLHRNTLANRLDLARSIVGSDLDDADGELGIRLALRMLEN